MIAQIDKQNAAMIADPVTPPRETRIRSNVNLANFPACVRPVPVRHLILKFLIQLRRKSARGSKLCQVISQNCGRRVVPAKQPSKGICTRQSNVTMRIGRSLG